MLSNEILGFIGGALGFIVYAPYWYGIYKGETKPHGFSWLVWALVTGIGYFAQVTDNAGPGAWALGVTSLNCLLIAIYGFWHGEQERTTSDWATFLCALAVIPIWMVTENALLTVAFVCVIDTLGCWPTIRKSIMKPWDEPISSHGLAVVKYGFGLLALDNFSFVTAGYLITLIVLDGLLVAMLLVRRRSIPKPNSA